MKKRSFSEIIDKYKDNAIYSSKHYSALLLSDSSILTERMMSKEQIIKHLKGMMAYLALIGIRENVDIEMVDKAFDSFIWSEMTRTDVTQWMLASLVNLDNALLNRSVYGADVSDNIADCYTALRVYLLGYADFDSFLI